MGAQPEVTMIEIRQILCPVDFSDHSRRALDHAFAIAKWYDSSVTPLHVLSFVPVAAYAPGSPMFPPIPLTDVDREQVLVDLKRFAETPSAGAVRMEARLREGHTVDEILAEAEALPADLLVIGTHGRSGFERLVLGSVAERLVRKASGPVLSVPPQVGTASSVFKRILCPLDFSDASMQALKYAMSLAQEADARLTVLHVMQYKISELPEMHDPRPSGRPLSLDEFRARCEEETRRRLEEAVPQDVKAYARVETKIASGKPYQAILAEAAQEEADLIVMGVHGRNPVDLMFLGSTTQHVLRRAGCPVLTLRSA
jgi:nucleotide-binding universal stress UspA family protein